MCLSFILRLLLKSVGAKLCRMNFKCSKTVILGTLSLVLLKLSLLGVSRHTPSSYMLIAHSNDIKLIWWHLGIGRSMGLIMRKDSPSWLKWLLSTLLRPLLFPKDGRFVRCIFAWWPERRNLYVSSSWFFFLLLLLRFIIWNGLYMVWSRHHRYGLRSFILLCWVLHLLKINMTSFYFFTKLPLGPLYFLCVDDVVITGYNLVNWPTPIGPQIFLSYERSWSHAVFS